MVKEGQSLLDFINFFPLQAIKIHRAPLSNKEAQTLFSIWEGDRDNDGNIVLSNDIDSMQVATLKTKGLIRSKPSMASILSGNANLIEITKQGQDVIRNIVLYTEKNAFEKKSAKDIDYESIFVAMTDNPAISTESQKIASKEKVLKVISSLISDAD